MCKFIELWMVLQEELINTMNSMKTKLEKEMLGHQEAKTQVQELTAQLEELHRMVCTPLFSLYNYTCLMVHLA